MSILFKKFPQISHETDAKLMYESKEKVRKLFIVSFLRRGARLSRGRSIKSSFVVTKKNSIKSNSIKSGID